MKTDRLTLRPLEIGDTENFYKWEQDRSVTLYSLSSYAYPKSKNDIHEWLSNINKSKSEINFGIISNNENKLIS